MVKDWTGSPWPRTSGIWAPKRRSSNGCYETAGVDGTRSGTSREAETGLGAEMTRPLAGNPHLPHHPITVEDSTTSPKLVGSFKFSFPKLADMQTALTEPDSAEPIQRIQNFKKLSRIFRLKVFTESTGTISVKLSIFICITFIMHMHIL